MAKETYLWNVVAVYAQDPENPSNFIPAPFQYHIIIGAVIQGQPPVWPPIIGSEYVNEVRENGQGGLFITPAAPNLTVVCFGKKTVTTEEDPWDQYGVGGATIA